jgi:hypothetical protein
MFVTIWTPLCRRRPLIQSRRMILTTRESVNAQYRWALSQRVTPV